MRAGGHALGRRGERIAVQYLSDAGYLVLVRNWRGRAGEVDVVARDTRPGRDELVFCEVKARSATRWGDPSGAVDAAKQARLRRVAAEYLAEGPGWCGAETVRFDVIEVVFAATGLPCVSHIADAFGS